jgi:hypothetical protein
MTAITERAERETDQQDGKRCEAVIPFIGIDWPCGEPAIGLFRRACVHEHIRDGWVCQGHVDATEHGFCLTCASLGDDMAHDCPISLTEVST